MVSLALVLAFTVSRQTWYHADGQTCRGLTLSSCSAPTATISTSHPAVDSRASMVRDTLSQTVSGTLTITIPGAFFGTTFAHLFFQTYRELAPAPFWKAPMSNGSPLSPRSASGSIPNRTSPFVNPNPHGGQKRANGFVYVPRIYGFKVSERAKNGPRMQWLRLRPESPEELDMVDWRGRWIDEDDEYDDTEEEEEEDRRMEDFDPVRVGDLSTQRDTYSIQDAAEDEDDDEEEEEEEEDGGKRIPIHPAARRHAALSPTSSSPVSSIMPQTPKDREAPVGSVKAVRQWNQWRATPAVRSVA
jgi:casein kinase II subunit beta